MSHLANHLTLDRGCEDSGVRAGRRKYGPSLGLTVESEAGQSCGERSVGTHSYTVSCLKQREVSTTAVLRYWVHVTSWGSAAQLPGLYTHLGTSAGSPPALGPGTRSSAPWAPLLEAAASHPAPYRGQLSFTLGASSQAPPTSCPDAQAHTCTGRP